MKNRQRVSLWINTLGWIYIIDSILLVYESHKKVYLLLLILFFFLLARQEWARFLTTLLNIIIVLAFGVAGLMRLTGSLEGTISLEGV
ncbi:MAG: hypothetical protein AAF518_28350 [Spirochaetota bacterium]